MKILRNETLFYCNMCGKVSRDIYGDKPLDKGWDTSCVLNASELRALDDCFIPDRGPRRHEFFLEKIESGSMEFTKEQK